jgi:hypothetical protein
MEYAKTTPSANHLLASAVHEWTVLEGWRF